MALPPTALRQTFERILEGCSVEMRERIVRLRDGPSRNAKKRAERVVSELAASGGGREDEDALKAVELKLLLWNSPEDGLVRRWKLSAEGSTAYVRFLAANFLNADRAYKEARYHGDAAVSRACARRRALSLFDLSGLKGQDHAMGEGLNALAADAHFCTAIAQLTEMDDAALATDRPEDGEDDEVSGLLSLGGSVRMATSFGSGVGGEGGAAEGGEAAWLFGDAMCVASEAAEVLIWIAQSDAPRQLCLGRNEDVVNALIAAIGNDRRPAGVAVTAMVAFATIHGRMLGLPGGGPVAVRSARRGAAEAVARRIGMLALEPRAASAIVHVAGANTSDGGGADGGAGTTALNYAHAAGSNATLAIAACLAAATAVGDAESTCAPQLGPINPAYQHDALRLLEPLLGEPFARATLLPFLGELLSVRPQLPVHAQVTTTGLTLALLNYAKMLSNVRRALGLLPPTDPPLSGQLANEHVRAFVSMAELLERWLTVRVGGESVLHWALAVPADKGVAAQLAGARGKAIAELRRVLHNVDELRKAEPTLQVGRELSAALDEAVGAPEGEAGAAGAAGAAAGREGAGGAPGEGAGEGADANGSAPGAPGAGAAAAGAAGAGGAGGAAAGAAGADVCDGAGQVSAAAAAALLPFLASAALPPPPPADRDLDTQCWNALCPTPHAGLGLALLRCVGCHAALYCGRECQKAHWRAGHKVECQPLAAALAAAEAREAREARAAAGGGGSAVAVQ